jgi:hypothetical protein
MNMFHNLVGVTSSPETKDLTAAKIKAQGTYKAVKKSAHNAFKGFWYPTYKDMTDAILPSLLANGIACPVYQQGYIPELGWVLIGTLKHVDGQFETTMVPLRDPVDNKQGRVDESMQGLEGTVTYARKIAFMELTGGWLEGDEPEVKEDQVNDAVRELMAPAGEQPAKVPTIESAKRLDSAMKACRSMPKEVERLFIDAENMAQAGDITAEQLARLTKVYGALRPKKQTEVSHA